MNSTTLWFFRDLLNAATRGAPLPSTQPLKSVQWWLLRTRLNLCMCNAVHWFSLATKALQKVKAKYLGLLIRPSQKWSLAASVSFPSPLHPLNPVCRPADWTEGQKADLCQNSGGFLSSPPPPFSPTILLMCVDSGPPNERVLLPDTICSACTLYEKIKNMWH